MKRGAMLAIFGTLTLCSNLAGAQQSSLVQTRAFAPGQSVRLEVNVGDIHVLPNPDDRQLRLVIRPKREISQAEMQSWVKDFNVNGNQGTIRLHMPKQGHDSGTVEVYVPSVTELNVDLGVGDVAIEGIAGDKDVSIHVGELKLYGLHRADYGHVEVGTGIGDVKDSAFSAGQSGWLGKSQDFRGNGKYHIQAHVGIGDIRLQTSGTGGTD